MADFNMAFKNTMEHEGGYVDDKDDRDLEEDGFVGAKTIKALAKFLQKDNPDYLLKLLNILQGARYVEIMKNNPTQEKYARGWLNRVSITRA